MTPMPPDTALLELGRSLQREGYRFITPTPATHQRVLQRAPHPARDLRDVFGWSRPFEPGVLSLQQQACLRDADQLDTDGPLWRARLRFSNLGELLLAHSAYPTAAADSVFFGPDTYRFCSLLSRWDTGADTVVDIGAGSGAGGLWLAHLRPRREVLLTDINERALALARVNARLAGIEARTLVSDLFAALPELPDLCVANPPYMKDAGQRSYRDGGGTHGEGLSLRIAREWLERARPGQALILYTGSAIVDGRDAIVEGVAALARLHGVSELRAEEIDPDVFGEELEQPGYDDVERIAAVGVRLVR